MAKPRKWTEEDITNITNRTRELRLKDYKPALVSLINQAQQELLPPERRKKILSLNNAKDIIQRLEAVPAAPMAPMAPAVPAVPAVPDSATISVSINPTQILEALKDQSEMMELVFYQINDILNILKTKPVVIEEKKENLKKVLIVGLLNSQANIVKELTKHFAKVRFLDTDKASRLGLDADCDCVILMKKFISHVVFNDAQKLGKTVILHEGGIKTLVKRIKEL